MKSKLLIVLLALCATVIVLSVRTPPIHAASHVATLSSQIITINPGLEDGDLTGFVYLGNASNFYSISSAQNHTLGGAFSLLIHPQGGETTLGTVTYPVVGGQVYTASIWTDITQCVVLANNDLYVMIFWLKADGSSAGVSGRSDRSIAPAYTIGHYTTTTAGWEQTTAPLTAPALAVTVQIVFDADSGIASPGQEIMAYVDDLSLIGPTVAVQTHTFLPFVAY